MPNKPDKPSKPAKDAKPVKPYSIQVGGEFRSFRTEKAFKDFMKTLLKGTIALSGRKSLQLKK